MPKPIPPQDYLQKCFDYQEGQLVWKYDASDSIKAGSVAGNLRPDGYIQITLDYVNYLAHRLIYMWHYDNCPAVVHHLDDNPSNNRIENLRGVSQSVNLLMINKTTAKSGHRGVLVTKNGRFQVRAKINGKKKSLGTYSTLDEASHVYDLYRQRRLNDAN